MNVLFWLPVMLTLAFGGALAAQPSSSDGENAVFIEQAEDRADTERPPSVYSGSTFPAYRDNNVLIAQEATGADDGQSVEQIATPTFDLTSLAQLSVEEVSILLAQLDDTERQVLVETVRGTDICEKENQSEPVELLCSNRIETRSEEFAQRRLKVLSPEERLLGEGLDGTPTQSLESTIRRLTRNPGSSDRFADQAIASVAPVKHNGTRSPKRQAM